MKLHGVFTALLLLALLVPASSRAIGVAIPSDMHTYQWTGISAQVQPGAIMTTQWQQLGDIQRGYAVGYDESGEIVYFKQGPLRVGLSYWSPNQYNGRHIHGVGHIAHPEAMQILEADMTEALTIPKEHPDHPDWYITAFECLQDDNGDIWTVWFDPEIVDMSQIVPGGNPEATVLGNVIEKWDENGNVLWTWNSHDHMTGLGNDLDYTMLDNQDALLSDYFETMHVNGMHLTPDGDLLISARFMSILILVDYPSGDIQWRMGGGSGNQWTFTGDAGGHPLGFNRQHDGYIWPDGNLTVYDNGNAHPDPRSYAREYSLNTQTMEAELVWYYFKDQEFASNITGSVRKLDNGNRLICWGALDPPVHVTEVNANNEVVWEMHTDNDPVFGIPPRHVRAEKTVLQPSAVPYVCPVFNPLVNQIEIVCNWFGHEAEVSSYEVYLGVDENNLALHGTTTSGTYYFNDAVMVQEYFCQIQPLDGNGDPAGPLSDVIRMQFEEDGLALTPISTTVPDNGGTVLYAAHVTNGTANLLPGLTFQTEVVLPNGNNYGPLLQIPFTLFPYMTIEASSLTLQVPAFAPAGDYSFVGNVWDGGDLLYTDSFGFSKTGAAAQGIANTSDFVSAGDVSPFTDTRTTVASDDLLPATYVMETAYPNPFNPTTTVNVALPETAELALAVYNISGQLVSTINDGRLSAGTHSFVFDASNLASGLYFVRASVPGQLNAVQKVMLVR